MTKVKCEYCDFIGHGYQMMSHYDWVHTAHIDVEVELEGDNAKITFPNGATVKVPIQVRGRLAKIQVAGRWTIEKERRKKQ